MYTQRQTQLHSHIRSDGCALVSCVYATVNYLSQKVITPQRLNEIYKASLREEIMKERSAILEWALLFNQLGLPVQYYGHLGRDWEPGEGEFEIVKWVLRIPHENIDWQHFTFGRPGADRPFADPWGSAGPGYHTSRTVAEGVVESTRGFRVLKEGWR